MHVPEELARRPHWIVWKTITRKGKPTKLPFAPLSHYLASTDNPKTWATLAQAQTAMATQQYSGLGFVFAKADSVFGIDLDSCFGSLFTLTPWAEKLLRMFATYAEISPSGHGVKLFGIGEHQTTGCVWTMGDAVQGEKRPAVEVYGWGRYFAFTGQKIDDAPADLRDCRHELAALVTSMPRTNVKPSTSPARQPRTLPERSKLERGRLYLHKVPPATSGSGGHNRTFRAACVLVRDIGLSQADAFDLLMEWNDKCLPPWTEKELLHKVSDAAKRQ